MTTALYWLVQCLWGLPQTLLGLALLAVHRKDEHFFFHCALVTRWQGRSSLSVGPFVFITGDPYFYPKVADRMDMEEAKSRLLVHEYGHTIQSLVLGPLYLVLIGVPSTLWGFLPWCAKRRQQGPVSYFAFFTERWANAWGEKVTGKTSMEQLLID